MGDEQKYLMEGLDEYIRQGEPQQRERSEAWKVAIGLQQVDRLQTSEYLLDTAKQHIEGNISIGEAKQLIDSYYQSASGRKLMENGRTEEADKVSARITELLGEKTFSFTPHNLSPYTAACSTAFTNCLAVSVTTTSPRTNGYSVARQSITPVQTLSATRWTMTWDRNGNSVTLT